MARELFAAFTMADMQRLDVAEFKRGRDRRKRKKKGMGLAAKIGLGVAGAGALGLAGRYGLAAAGGARAATTRYGFKDRGFLQKVRTVGRDAGSGVSRAFNNDIYRVKSAARKLGESIDSMRGKKKVRRGDFTPMD